MLILNRLLYSGNIFLFYVHKAYTQNTFGSIYMYLSYLFCIWRQKNLQGKTKKSVFWMS